MRPLTCDASGPDLYRGASWSPDGSKVVYGPEGDGDTTYVVLDSVDATELFRIDGNIIQWNSSG